MMSVRGTIAAAAAALAVVGGVAVAASFSANAETASCGASCVELYGGLPDITLGQPSFLIDSYKEGQVTGTPIIEFAASNSDSAEDFTVYAQGLASDFAGVVSAAVEQAYGDDAAYEIEYSPSGAPTGECVGVEAAPVSSEKVTLQPCAVSSKTIWIADSSASITNSFVPLVNGATPDVSDPFVLTYPPDGDPNSTPPPQLYVDNLAAGPVPDNQLWSALGDILGGVLSIAKPGSIITDATSPSGATVTYSLPAVTDPDATTPPAAVCTPPSGSTFAIGTTTVTCTATDSKDINSPVSTTFTVTVKGAAAQLASLYQAVQGSGVYDILALFVSIAQHAVTAGNTHLACQSLNAFINDARLQLPAASAAPLIAAAKQIEAVLAC